MPRRTKVNYFPSRGAYYCQIGKKQYHLATGPDDAPLGPVFQEACRAYGQLVGRLSADQAGEENTVETVCNLWLERTADTVTPERQEVRTRWLKPFVEELGHLQVHELIPFRIEEFIAQMQKPRIYTVGRNGGQRTCKWGPGGMRSFLTSASAAFNWAVKRKLIKANPFKDIPIPSPRSRSRDCIISPELHQKVLDSCVKDWHKYACIALENTGARPSEIIAAEARYWDAGKQALVYHADARRKPDEYRHKSAATKDRVICFTGEALALILNLIEKYPTGPLFRDDLGRRIARYPLQLFFLRRRRRWNQPGLTAYSYRHTLATRWLLAGGSVEILAEILGNTPAVIMRHYSHLCGEWPTIRQRLEVFWQTEQTSRPSTSPEPPDDADVAPGEPQ